MQRKRGLSSLYIVLGIYRNKKKKTTNLKYKNI